VRQQVPIRTFARWDEVPPGFAELDVVAHDGGCARGDVVQTLTDIAWGWTQASRLPQHGRGVGVCSPAARAGRLGFPLRGIFSEQEVRCLHTPMVPKASPTGAAPPGPRAGRPAPFSVTSPKAPPPAARLWTAGRQARTIAPPDPQQPPPLRGCSPAVPPEPRSLQRQRTLRRCGAPSGGCNDTSKALPPPPRKPISAHGLWTVTETLHALT